MLGAALWKYYRLEGCSSRESNEGWIPIASRARRVAAAVTCGRAAAGRGACTTSPDQQSNQSLNQPLPTPPHDRPGTTVINGRTAMADVGCCCTAPSACISLCLAHTIWDHKNNRCSSLGFCYCLFRLCQKVQFLKYPERARAATQHLGSEASSSIRALSERSEHCWASRPLPTLPAYSG